MNKLYVNFNRILNALLSNILTLYITKVKYLFLKIYSLIPDMELILNSGLAAHCSKINTQKKSDVGKGNIILFRKLATWKDGRQTSQRPFSPSR